MTRIDAFAPAMRPTHPPRSRTRATSRTTDRIFRSAKNETSFVSADRLQDLLYRVLETEPVVQAFEPAADGSVEVRYWGGRVLVAPLPATGAARLQAKRLKRAHARNGRRMVLVPEHRLTRWPDRDSRGVVADCGHAALRPSERATVVDALLENGGSCELGDLARLLPTSQDPVAAVLLLVSKGILKIDTARPVDGRSTVELFDPFVLRR